MGDDIEFIKNLNTSQLIEFSDFFQNNDVVKLDLSTLNKTKIKTMPLFICNSNSLQYIDVSGSVKVLEKCFF